MKVSKGQFSYDQVVDHSVEVAPYLIDCSNGTETRFQIMSNNGLSGDNLLLDSCSTVCLISNGDLLHNIHTVDHWMKVRCNAGVQSKNKMGCLGSFPDPVWYDPKGIAHIMSLLVVQKYYRVSYDSKNGNRFKVELKNDNLTFAPTAKGLYSMICQDKDEDRWNMIMTIKEKSPAILSRDT
jgi:hypothetical protein